MCSAAATTGRLRSSAKGKGEWWELDEKEGEDL